MAESSSLLRDTRRSASMVLPRSRSPAPALSETAMNKSDNRTRSRRMSLSPWRSRPKPVAEETDASHIRQRHSPPVETVVTEKKGLWNWKVMRALSRVGMRRVGCLFSVEVVGVNDLPGSMNGLRLAVAVRKKESKEGAMQTMPARVLHRSANFDETLFIRCHIYCTGGAGTGKQLKFEPRPFVISAMAVDALELDFGRTTVDLSELVKESIERSLDGDPIRQWDAVLKLSGKAKGGELVLKLGFQLMEDGGVSLYQQAEGMKAITRRSLASSSSSSFAWRQSKYSFSVESPRSMRMEASKACLNEALEIDLKRVNDDDEFNLEELGPPAPSSPSIQKSEPELKEEEFDLLPEFEVIEKGIEVPMNGKEEKVRPNEIVKQVVHKVDGEVTNHPGQEELATKEFLQVFDDLGDGEPKPAEDLDGESVAFLTNLGKGLGCAIQTKDGGYLAAMNPFDVEIPIKQMPKLAMQISRPFVLVQDQELTSGFELFQRLAAVGSDKLPSEVLSLASMDELQGKTAEQIAFEGIASAIVSGRNKEAAKEMGIAMIEGRKERILTGIWEAHKNAMTTEEILKFSMQKMEAMATEALKIQADSADEEAPIEVSPLRSNEHKIVNPLNSATKLEDMVKTCKNPSNVTILLVIQLRDPLRQYEPVGAPMIVMAQAARVKSGEEEEPKFKVTSLHVGGIKAGSEGVSSAMQWVVAHGLGKAGKKKSKVAQGKGGGQDLMWSLSARVMADVWLKHVRNPDVKITNK